MSDAQKTYYFCHSSSLAFLEFAGLILDQVHSFASCQILVKRMNNECGSTAYVKPSQEKCGTVQSRFFFHQPAHPCGEFI